ncbi:hypothetical protein PV10_08893 [Exophiala mesophila]|uniref:AAA+ ATPase domain-containing protein n=1 Tax=Exophiala mesophila TaxID=212818 RepID=A0A0D1XME7_EXOME|nr:uncharacterized protein PV10_08893 [Exophiala mesophila]KIV89316.1 hypothetical protein PV10_08893 [Exophiala mesophila]
MSHGATIPTIKQEEIPLGISKSSAGTSTMSTSHGTMIHHGTHRYAYSGKQPQARSRGRTRRRARSLPNAGLGPRLDPRSADTNDSQTSGSLEEMAGYQSLLQGKTHDLSDEYDFNASLDNRQVFQYLKNIPFFSNDVRKTLKRRGMQALGSSDLVAFPHFGLLGVRKNTATRQAERPCPPHNPDEDLIFFNTNAPWSAFICGSQGSGKSHTLACFLENSLLKSSPAGRNPTPLAGVVFHYDRFTSSSTTQLCRAAYLCALGVPVRVLVSPSHLTEMEKLYQGLPGLAENGMKPEVLPLYMKESHLTVASIMSFMTMDGIDKIPLCMEVLCKTLRDIAREKGPGAGLDYLDFTARLERKGFFRMDAGVVSLRLQLIETFLAGRDQSADANDVLDTMFTPAPGTLTIVDLTCPFINEGDACALFAQCLSLFMEKRGECGRIVALDQADRYLTQSGEAERLTKQVASIIRHQTHLATRVMVAAQEPTLSPKLLELFDVTILHHFNSPTWYRTLTEQVASVRLHSEHNAELFQTIASLNTGRALIFSPPGILDVHNDMAVIVRNDIVNLKIRSRLPTDGGERLLSVGMASSAADEVSARDTVARPAAPTCTAESKSSQNKTGSMPSQENILAALRDATVACLGTDARPTLNYRRIRREAGAVLGLDSRYWKSCPRKVQNRAITNEVLKYMEVHNLSTFNGISRRPGDEMG